MNFGKLLLLGGAGFLAYRYAQNVQSAPAPASNSAPAGGIIPATTPATTAPAPPPPPVTNPATTRELMLAEARKRGFPALESVHGWNWLYLQVRGVPAPSPDQWGLTSADDARQMTFDEWWSLASGHGLGEIIPMIRYAGEGPNNFTFQGGYRRYV